LKKENASLKAELKAENNKNKLKAISDGQFELKKEFLVKEGGSLDMLDSEAVSSIDISIKELKNMVKKQ